MSLSVLAERLQDVLNIGEGSDGVGIALMPVDITVGTRESTHVGLAWAMQSALQAVGRQVRVWRIHASRPSAVCARARCSPPCSALERTLYRVLPVALPHRLSCCTPLAARILLIEDDPDSARLLSVDLAERGCEVQHAASAVAGLLSARETPRDLVLLDLGLPDFDGGLVVIRLRVNPPLPTIALTARDAPEEQLRLFELGVNDYVVKPAHPDKLVARIRMQRRVRTASRLSLSELEI